MVLWFVAWWIVWGLMWFILRLWSVDDAGWWATLAAWGYMAVLAFEGVRYGKKLFDLSSLADTYYVKGFTDTDQEQYLRAYLTARGVGDPMGAAWIVSQTTLAAPRCTINAWRAWKRIVRADEKTRAAAQDLFDRLLAKRRWLPLGQANEDTAALWALDRAGMLWTRIEDGEAQVRIAADLTHQLHEGR